MPQYNKTDPISQLLQLGGGYGRFLGADSDTDNPYLVPHDRSLPGMNEFSRLFPKHPRIAGALENAALMLATTPQSDTIGGNIAGVAGAFLGLPQARMQRNLAMLTPGMQLREAEEKSQLAKLQAETAKLQGSYWAARPGIEREELASRERESAAERKSRMDVEQMRGMFGIAQDFERNRTRPVSDTEIEELARREDNERIARGEAPMNAAQRRDFFDSRYRARAGAAAQGAFPTQQRGAFIAREMSEQNILRDLPYAKVQPTQLMGAYVNRAVMEQGLSQQDFNNMVARQQAEAMRRMQAAPQWQFSTAPDQNIGFLQWYNDAYLPSQGGQPSRPGAQSRGRLTPELVDQYLEQNNNDPQRAREAAQRDGYSF